MSVRLSRSDLRITKQQDPDPLYCNVQTKHKDCCAHDFDKSPGYLPYKNKDKLSIGVKSLTHMEKGKQRNRKSDKFIKKQTFK